MPSAQVVSFGIIFVFIVFCVLVKFLLHRSKTNYKRFSNGTSFQYPKEFPQPGEEIIHSFAIKRPVPTEIRVTSLNMERGKQMDKILSQLKKLDSDFILLQEVDFFSRRGERIDQTAELAKFLQMNSYWVCEYQIHNKCSLPDPMNSEHLGCEGNAILSKYPFKITKAILLNCQQVLHPGHRPFKKHVEAFVVVDIPNISSIGLCSAHLDPHYTGVQGRSKQYSELISKLLPFMNFPLIVGGDFNTVCSGIGRINIPKLCPDISSALGSLGKPESRQFQENSVSAANLLIEKECGPESILSDPFDKLKDTTFCGMSGLYNAKLDWCLLSSHFRPTSFVVGNRPQDHCSDHMWITIQSKLPRIE